MADDGGSGLIVCVGRRRRDGGGAAVVGDGRYGLFDCSEGIGAHARSACGSDAAAAGAGWVVVHDVGAGKSAKIALLSCIATPPGVGAGQSTNMSLPSCKDTPSGVSESFKTRPLYWKTAPVAERGRPCCAACLR